MDIIQISSVVLRCYQSQRRTWRRLGGPSYPPDLFRGVPGTQSQMALWLLGGQTLRSDSQP